MKMVCPVHESWVLELHKKNKLFFFYISKMGFRQSYIFGNIFKQKNVSMLLMASVPSFLAYLYVGFF